MAPDELPSVPDPLEERLRGRLRAVAGWVILALLVVLALADTFGAREDIHASTFVFGGLLAALLLLAGVEGWSRFLGNGKK